MPTTLGAQEFVCRWRGATLKERSAAQSHFNDLGRLVGHPTPTEYDAHGKPVEPEWPAVDLIEGNPPLLGRSKIRSELGNGYKDQIFKLYDDRLPNFSDRVLLVREGKVDD